MDLTIRVGDTVSHYLGGPSGKVISIFQFGLECYLEIEGQLGALPLRDAIKIEEGKDWTHQPL